MRSTQFRPHAIGVKTRRMLEVEARLGRTLEEDFQEYYVEKGWGQKKLANRWGATRAAIFGRGETTDIRCWVQVLKLPIRREREAAPKPRRAAPACELCGRSDVPLEGAHWIPGAEGGDATPSNILKLCPNCHKQLDLREDPTVTAQARAVLLARVARRFVESPRSTNREEQLRFVALCRTILEARSGTRMVRS
jgi:5-methylcytosine-specific restriction endonuclease McrA